MNHSTANFEAKLKVKKQRDVILTLVAMETERLFISSFQQHKILIKI